MTEYCGSRKSGAVINPKSSSFVSHTVLSVCLLLGGLATFGVCFGSNFPFFMPISVHAPYSTVGVSSRSCAWQRITTHSFLRNNFTHVRRRQQNVTRGTFICVLKQLHVLVEVSMGIAMDGNDNIFTSSSSNGFIKSVKLVCLCDS